MMELKSPGHPRTDRAALILVIEYLSGWILTINRLLSLGLYRFQSCVDGLIRLDFTILAGPA